MTGVQTCALPISFPGAFLRLGDVILRIHRTRLLPTTGDSVEPPHVTLQDERLTATCGDGHRLEILEAVTDDGVLDATRFRQLFGNDKVFAPDSGPESRTT